MDRFSPPVFRSRAAYVARLLREIFQEVISAPRGFVGPARRRSIRLQTAAGIFDGFFELHLSPWKSPRARSSSPGWRVFSGLLLAAIAGWSVAMCRRPAGVHRDLLNVAGTPRLARKARRRRRTALFPRNEAPRSFYRQDTVTGSAALWLRALGGRHRWPPMVGRASTPQPPPPRPPPLGANDPRVRRPAQACAADAQR